MAETPRRVEKAELVFHSYRFHGIAPFAAKAGGAFFMPRHFHIFDVRSHGSDKTSSSVAMFKSANNKFLKVKEGVRLNPALDAAIVELDKDFEEAGLEAWVTSGERTSEDQLETIRGYAKRNGVDKEFPEILTCGVNDKIDFGTQKIFTWQRAWSRLLNIGVIINPPIPAKCLFDYIRDGVNKRGIIIGYSPHYYKKALDIGGGTDRNPSNEAEVVKKAIARRAPGIKGLLLEPKNNCCHVDIYG